jgi:signal transduction histidine kinase
VSEVLREALDLLGPLARERNVGLEAQVTEVADHYVLADRQRLKQVLLNLLSNAVKYNREGGAVTISCDETARSGLRIAVGDTGPGIPSGKMERLFVPFERLGAEQTREEGTGLGLALAKKLAEAMGGTIGVESTVGAGARSGWSWSWWKAGWRRWSG